MSVRDVLAKLGANPDVAQAVEDACEKFGIDTPLRIRHFYAQASVESANFTRFRESLNYSAEALLKLFSRSRISEADAHRYGRTKDHPANQPRLADILYGGTFGAKNLGNTQPGDGSRFIGRGAKQLTGRDNYTRYSLAMYGDKRCIDQPELLEQLPDAVLSAGWFWQSNNLNVLADKNDIVAVTKKVNGGDIGLDDRKRALARATQIYEDTNYA